MRQRMRGAQVQYGKAHGSHFPLRRGHAPLVCMITTAILLAINITALINIIIATIIIFI